jgi:hypothetical protein
MIGAGMLLPLQTPAQAKTNYQHAKNKKYKVHKFKAQKFKNKKFKAHRATKH